MKRGYIITSRIGKRPVVVPDGVEVMMVDQQVKISGQHGQVMLSLRDYPLVTLNQEDSTLTLSPASKHPGVNAQAGLLRAILQNAVSGVVEPFVKELQLVGTGFRAELEGSKLTIRCGYSHPVVVELPETINAEIEKNTIIRLRSIFKDQLGNFAAHLRMIRPPDPYKGKGIRYLNEQLSLKPGKAAKAVGAAAA